MQLFPKTHSEMANSVNTEQTVLQEQFDDVGLYCLHMPFC